MEPWNGQGTREAKGETYESDHNFIQSMTNPLHSSLVAKKATTKLLKEPPQKP